MHIYIDINIDTHAHIIIKVKIPISLIGSNSTFPGNSKLIASSRAL